MFKVGDKFIVEVDGVNTPPANSGAVNLYRIKDLNYCLWAENSLVLPEKQLEKLAKVSDLKDEVKEAYKKGYAKASEDIQEVVRMLLAMDYNDKDLYFGGSHITAEILSEFDVREIVERLEAYKKEQSEIRVGDEVEIIDFGCEAVVTCTNKHLKSVFVLYTDGSTDEFTDRTKLRKTGRHFDEVEKLIEILKGGEDSEQILL